MGGHFYGLDNRHRDLVSMGAVGAQYPYSLKDASAKVNIKYQGPKGVAQFHLFLMFENPNDFEM